jgi:hypothetical protein
MTQENAFQLLSHLIGTPFVPAVGAYIKELTGYSVKDPDEQEQDAEDAKSLLIALNPVGGILWFNLIEK